MRNLTVDKGDSMVFPICNRRPDRAPKVFNKTFVLCWRCTMFAVGIIIAALILELNGFKYNKLLIMTGLIFQIPVVIDGSLQYFMNVESVNKRRGLTGFVSGLGAGMIIYTMKILIL